MKILSMDHVSYGYEKGKTILKDISVSFETGKVYAIIGKSGNGKSTMLSLLAGLDVPDQGEVYYKETSTRKMDLDEYRRKNAAIIYQDFSLFPLLTVLENIMYPMELCHIPTEEVRSTAQQLATKVSLAEKLWNQFPANISGGEKQRVAIARALTMNRKLILADEPTGSLDSENTKIIIDDLKRLAHEEDCCVIVVTHDFDVMQEADQVFQMREGVLA